MSDYVIKLKNISRQYRQGRSSVQALSECDYNVKPSTINSIIGPSGCGKSTLLHIAGLLDQPTTGEVFFEGNRVDNLNNHDAAKLRLQNMGFIYQYHHLLRDFSAIENVAMPLLLQGLKSQIAMEKSGALLKRLGLGNRLYNYPDELSGGEQQRVAIARAVIHQPKLILADEPTGNLDPEASSQVFELFINLVKEHNLAAIIVTHNHELAKKSDSVFEISS